MITWIVMVAIALAIYLSFKAVGEEEGAQKQARLKQCLKMWLFIFSDRCISGVLGPILSWIPFFDLFKIVVYIFCLILPGQPGLEYIFGYGFEALDGLTAPYRKSIIMPVLSRLLLFVYQLFLSVFAPFFSPETIEKTSRSLRELEL